MRRFVLSMLCVAGVTLPAHAGAIFTDYTDASRTGDPGNGKGVAFADVDNDGDWDMYISNKGGGSKLFLNDGKGVYSDVTEKSGVGDTGFVLGSIFFDYDNDGLADLYIPKGGRYEIESNRLFKNIGGGKFVDVTDKAGVGFKGFTYSASSADYNNDGHLDLYLAVSGVGKTNVLYRNNGNGTFTDVTAQAGVGDRSWSWMGTWADVNNDGLQDLYVVNGRYPAGEANTLYINKGDGSFSSEAVERGVSDPNWGLGAAFADVDNDGDLDLFVSNYVGPNALYVNDGKGFFSKSAKAGVDEAGWGKGPTFGDIDHDGDLDLYEGDCKGASKLFRNNGNGTFTNITEENPGTRCASVRTKGTMFVDMDNDGDLDLYTVHWGAPNKLFKNNTNDKNWLKVRLKGTVSNGMAVGSRVWVRDGQKLMGMSDLVTASGFCAQPPQELSFGLPYGKTYTVEVRFPSGARKVLEGVKAGQTLMIEEPGEVASK